MNDTKVFHIKGMCHKHLRGGVYQFCALRAPDADPQQYWPIPSGPPQNAGTWCTPPPQIDFAGKIFKGKFCEPTQKKQNNSKYTPGFGHI